MRVSAPFLHLLHAIWLLADCSCYQLSLLQCQAYKDTTDHYFGCQPQIDTVLATPIKNHSYSSATVVHFNAIHNSKYNKHPPNLFPIVMEIITWYYTLPSASLYSKTYSQSFLKLDSSFPFITR